MLLNLEILHGRTQPLVIEVKPIKHYNTLGQKLFNKENALEENHEKSKTSRFSQKNNSQNENIQILNSIENHNLENLYILEDLNISDSKAQNKEEKSESVRSKWDDNIYKNIEVPFLEQ